MLQKYLHSLRETSLSCDAQTRRREHLHTSGASVVICPDVVSLGAVPKECTDVVRVVLAPLVPRAAGGDPRAGGADRCATTREQRSKLRVEHPPAYANLGWVGAVSKQHLDHRNVPPRHRAAQRAHPDPQRRANVVEEKAQRRSLSACDGMVDWRDVQDITGRIVCESQGAVGNEEGAQQRQVAEESGREHVVVCARLKQDLTDLRAVHQARRAEWCHEYRLFKGPATERHGQTMRAVWINATLEQQLHGFCPPSQGSGVHQARREGDTEQAGRLVERRLQRGVVPALGLAHRT